MKKTIEKILIGCLAASSMAACANLDAMKLNVANELRPDVVKLVSQCEKALLLGSINKVILIEMGLMEKSKSGGKMVFDNELPRAEKGRIVGTGLRFEFEPSEDKCSIGVGPDGFPETILSIVNSEMLSKGFTSDARGKIYTKNGETINVQSRRSGHFISYATTTISFTLN